MSGAWRRWNVCVYMQNTTRKNGKLAFTIYKRVNVYCIHSFFFFFFFFYWILTSFWFFGSVGWVHNTWLQRRMTTLPPPAQKHTYRQKDMTLNSILRWDSSSEKIKQVIGWCHGHNLTQDQFLSELELVSIQSFPSSIVVAYQRKKN